MQNQKSLFNTRTLAQLALLSAILFIMGFTPLGSLPLGGPIVATLAQIPVVIGAVLLGERAGMLLGGVFGLVSFLVMTIFGYPGAFVFSPVYSIQLASGSVPRAILYAVASVVICFVPRILIGFVSARVYGAIKGRTGKVASAAAAAGVCGSLTNTLLVLLGILVFFADPYAELNQNSIWIVLGTSILVNGIPEAIVTPIVTAGVVTPISRFGKGRSRELIFGCLVVVLTYGKENSGSKPEGRRRQNDDRRKPCGLARRAGPAGVACRFRPTG